MSTPEGKVKDAVRRVLKKHGAWYFSPVSNGLGKHGIPDFVCCFEGRFVGIECKARDGMEPTTLQTICHEDIKKANGTVFVVTPGLVDQLDRYLTNTKGR